MTAVSHRHSSGALSGAAVAHLGFAHALSKNRENFLTLTWL